jgi:hypothetical protein
MECDSFTEIAIHDAGNVVHSFMFYNASNFTIGRNMGWGIPNVTITGVLVCQNEIRAAGDVSGNGGGGIWRLSCPDSWVRLRDPNNSGHRNLAVGDMYAQTFQSFTSFLRCYTDDELYNNEIDENIDIFKNNFMGRVVIATGKIKTDLSRDVEAPEPVEPESDIKKVPDSEWYSLIDKDGITIEDVVPVVALSRQKKDKRVFGVLGTSSRNTNNKELIT